MSSHSEILSALENSPKGRLSYDTGWDAVPQSTWQLVSSIQAETEMTKHAVLERAYRASKVAERRRQSLNEKSPSSHNRLSPLVLISSTSGTTTSETSGSKSRQSVEGSPLSSTYKEKSFIKSRSSTSLPTKVEKRGYGIFDEYDEADMLKTEKEMSSPHAYSYIKVTRLTTRYKKEWESRCAARVKKFREFEEAQYLQAFKQDEECEKAATQQRRQMKEERERHDEQMIALVKKKLKRQQEAEEAQDLYYAEQRTKMIEDENKKRKEIEAAQKAQKLAEELEIQRQRETAAAVAEQQQQQEEVENRKRQEEAVVAADKAKQEQERAAENQRIAASVKPTPSATLVPSTTSSLPDEISGLILREDLERYTKFIELFDTCNAATQHISGSNPATKDFYMAGLKVINTPLNTLANASQIQSSVEHFAKLLKGLPVTATDTMRVPFQATSVQSGDVFALKLLAFRFVKKADAEITKGKTSVEPLATLGMSLCKQFPKWASLVQANFYKVCPFLVPFSFPRYNQTTQEYGKTLGFELSGNESSMVQVLIERITGYCTLYALMVRQFDAFGKFDIGEETTQFFTLGQVWRILSTTMKLEPQVDMTATVIHTLLDLLGDRLAIVYHTQFVKLIKLICKYYVPKIRHITPPGKAAALARLELFMESKYRINCD